MKTGKDFRREFPETEEGFRRAVDNALDGLADAPARRAFRVPRMAIALAAALLLLTSAAVAATMYRMNIQDFIDRSNYANLSEEARQVLMNSDFEDVVIANRYADITVTEAVYDGMALYALVEVKPKDEDTFYVPYYMMDSTAYTYGRSYPKDVGIRDYAEQLGYQNVMALVFRTDVEAGSYYDSCINEDGSFSLMWWSLVRPEYQGLPQLEVDGFVNFEKNGNRFASAPVSMVIPLAGEVQRAASPEGENAVIEPAGVQINSVEAIRTPMSTYIIVNYDIVDNKAYQNYMPYKSFVILDENGEAVSKGAFPLSLRIGRNEDKSIWGDRRFYLTNRIYDEMPTQVTVTISEDEESAEVGYTFHLQ